MEEVLQKVEQKIILNKFIFLKVMRKHQRQRFIRVKIFELYIEITVIKYLLFYNVS